MTDDPTTRGRPGMAASYGISKGDAGMLEWADVERRLIAATTYWLNTASPGGAPHAAPVWGVWLDGSLMFGTDAASRKGKNLAADPRLVVHLDDGDDAVILHGSVAEVIEPAERLELATRYSAKYGIDLLGDPPDPTAPGLYYRFSPVLAIAWLHDDYPGTATRWRFAE